MTEPIPAVVPPASTPAAPPAAVVLPPAPAPIEDHNPPWLKGRLDQAKASALAELGITDPAKAKEALAAAAKAEEEAKSQGQKLGETAKLLEAERARSAEASAIVAQQVGEQMAALTPEQQAAIRALAPDTDPIAQLKQLRLAAAFRTAPAPVTTTTTTPPAVAPGAPPPATTAPPAAAPPAAPGSPPDHKAEYQRLKATNPVKAAAYMNEHGNKIYPPA